MFCVSYSLASNHPEFATADPEWYNYAEFDTLDEAIAFRDKLRAEGVWSIARSDELPD